MIFENPAKLVELLLQQSDRHPIRAIGAEDLERFDPRFVRRLRALGVLVEREDLGDDGSSVFQVVDGDLFEVDLETGVCRRAGKESDVRVHEIDFAVLCREICNQSVIEGPGPMRISRRIWRLGRHVSGERGAEICLVRHMRPETAQEIMDHVRGAIDSESHVVVITPAPCRLPAQVERQLAGMRVEIHAACDLLGSDPKAPFALDLRRIALSRVGSLSDARLNIDRIGHRVVFDDVELRVEPRDFGVLVLLAEEATCAGGWVSRETILATIQFATGVTGNPEQIDRSINRLRNVFRKDDRLRDIPGNGFIETKPKVGYRLNLPPGSIAFTG